jgi:hypothetical protein
MKFSDPAEREKVIGPLYATAVKAEVPIFGPDKFTSKKIQQALNSTIKQDLESEDNPVVNSLATKKSRMSQTSGRIIQCGEPLAEDLNKLELATQENGKECESRNLEKVMSSRERHDEAHYTTCLGTRTNVSKVDLLDHVMLQRAIDGYLFNCKANKAIVKDDQWLHDIWEWIEGKEAVHFTAESADGVQVPKKQRATMEWFLEYSISVTWVFILSGRIYSVRKVSRDPWQN